MMAHLTNSPGHDTIASSYASTSTAASPNTSCKIRYDIFINHRGPDVKKSFASHLHRRLRLHGFEAFLDQQEMETGDRIDSQIEEVIATASVHVAIFSPRYAESKWCLEELVLMLKSGSPIIPVFYNVNPSELRWTSCKDGVYGRFLRILGWTGKNGVYAEALRIHEKKRRYDSKIVEGWREALSEVSYKSGLLLKEDCNGDEGELLDRVIQRVEKKVKKTELYTAAYPTGLDGKLKEFTETLLLEQQQHSRETKVVGIVGSGGVGKTTLAMEFFNRKRSDYDKSCFLEDVRETSLIDLQIKLIKDLTSLDLKISSISDGKGELSRRLSGFQALMILDDVDDDKQLDALFSPAVKKGVLSSDSLILVTSRNKNVLSRIRESPIYELTGLCSEHSERLFCLHAFHQRQAVVGFEELVTKFLDVCAGLPLSLKVVGALLFGKDLKDWKAELRKISKTPPQDVQSKLKISYDRLDNMEKEIFLDIACFFIKEDKDVAIRVWDSSHWEGRLNLQNLVNKCLVEIDSKNCITMHDHLRDMGRGLAQKEPRLRLWCPTENLSADAFQQSTMTTPVRGINMVQQSSGRSSENPVDLGTCFERMNGLRLLRAEGDCLGSISNLLRKSNLLWLRWDSYPNPSLPSWIPMKNLRVLQIAGDKLKTLWQSENAPVQLRELYIDAAHFQLPKSIAQLKHLKRIELRHTIETLPEELFHLCSLKHLRLSTRMMGLPNSLANLTKLRNIDLSGCTDLQTLPSFRNLTGLQHINLNDCKMLQMLPDSFGNLIQLKNLSLAGCRNLTISSETLGDIRTLESLDLSLCEKLEEFPSQVTLQRSLKILKLQCPLLETLPPSLGNLGGLKELTLHSCQKLTHLPDSVGELKQLRTLVIHTAGISCLPVGVTELNKLETLSVIYCPLIEMPFPTALADPKGRRVPDSSVDNCIGLLRLKDLDLHGTRIKELSFPRGFCPNLQRLNISHCLELLEVGALPTTLVSLHLKESYSLKKIEGLYGLGELRLLDVSECKEIEELPGVETLKSLDELRAFDCKRLKQTVRKLARATIDSNKKRKS